MNGFIQPCRVSGRRIQSGWKQKLSHPAYPMHCQLSVGFKDKNTCLQWLIQREQLAVKLVKVKQDKKEFDQCIQRIDYENQRRIGNEYNQLWIQETNQINYDICNAYDIKHFQQNDM